MTPAILFSLLLDTKSTTTTTQFNSSRLCDVDSNCSVIHQGKLIYMHYITHTLKHLGWLYCRNTEHIIKLITTAHSMQCDRTASRRLYTAVQIYLHSSACRLIFPRVVVFEEKPEGSFGPFGSLPSPKKLLFLGE